ncbi:MAG: M48 family metallopeptidase [Gammaproteobacteria bacterium]|nr:M48 family metallopeptidase [Gammaproteobacteria bacterium]MBU0770494.1 M48 family metallopeptidase [Gammaproteobacteria bacterium]MBU0856330.1 M48 family metallopeptidase [Gammaproteobacteria bacterium]MBU1845998.1 M48 family metallopeptidase [Gammaproteobacteria bacterium]
MALDMPDNAAPRPRGRHIVLGQQIIEYALRRSRRRSIGFSIGESGLRVTAPDWVTLPQIEQALREKQRWIFTKLGEVRARRAPVRTDWRDGARLPWLGGSVMLKLGDTCARPLIDDDVLRLPLPADADHDRVRDAVCGFLQQEALARFSRRAEELGARIGVAPSRVVLSSANTLWGSCTAQGVIRLNWRLIHFSVPLIDYVIAHELAHLKELNHSRAFWDTVGAILPGFEAARSELRAHHPGRIVAP